MLVEQVYIFGWSILTGVILGILFDLFRGLRWEGIRNVWVYIQDVIFWIVTAIIIIVSAFLINKGELRGYMLIGYLLGAGFYMLLFSHYILGALKFINKKIRNLFQSMGKAMKKVCESSNKKVSSQASNISNKMLKNKKNKQEI